ncbi:MAG: DUF2914 domain-containing protein [Myxococcales bacterium]|nr:DUF2914 domain-containing protein [Myxococcales bacterium]
MTGKNNAIVAMLMALVAAPALAEVGSEGVEGAASDQAAPAPEAAAAPAPSGLVARSTITTSVVDREPQDSVETLSNDNVEVFYFTEVRDATGDTITHRWEWMGTLMAEVPFAVGGPRWRLFSSKNLDPTWLGEWTVTAVDSSGRVLSQETFEYREAMAAPAVPAAPAAPAP